MGTTDSGAKIPDWRRQARRNMADEPDFTTLDSLIKRTRRTPDMRARLLTDPEPALAELGVVLPDGLDSWRAWREAHYCGCNELFVRNCACGPE